MPDSLKWLLAAMATVCGVAVISVSVEALVAVPETVEEADPAIELSAEAPVELAPEAVDLRVKVPRQSTDLSYGTRAEVLRFTLSADEPYSLRYLIVDVESVGLDAHALRAENWALHRAEEPGVLLGTGEAFADGRLRLRLNPLLGEPGREEFVLTTQVLRGDSEEIPQLSVALTGYANTTLWDWAWRPGWHEGSWLDSSENVGSQWMDGLPTEVLTRN